MTSEEAHSFCNENDDELPFTEYMTGEKLGIGRSGCARASGATAGGAGGGVGLTSAIAPVTITHIAAMV